MSTKATPTVPPPIITPMATPSQTVSEKDNMTLGCGSQLSPYVDTPVEVVITWTGPGGGGLMGSSTALLGGTYQSSLLVMSLSPDRTGTYNCSMSVLPNNSPYVTGTENYKTIEGKDINVHGLMVDVFPSAVALHTVTVMASSATPTAGMNYTLTCTAVTSNNVPSSSPPQLSWNKMMLGDLFLGTQTRQSTIGNTTTLSILFVPLYTSDEGTYTCQSNLSYPVSSVITKYSKVIIQSKGYLLLLPCQLCPCINSFQYPHHPLP